MAPHDDPRMPAPESCVLRDMLDARARTQPDRTFAAFQDGTAWSYAETRAQAIRTANALRALGVDRDERVVVWLPNGPDCLRVWFALNYLGAVYVPLNLAHRGRMLAHALDIAGAARAVVHTDLLPRLAEIDAAAAPLAEVAVLGGEPAPVDGLTLHPAAALDSTDETPPALARALGPWDTQAIIYTAGGGDASRGVVTPYLQLRETAAAPAFLGPEDRHMVDLPLFHSGGVMAVTSMLIHGGSIALYESFATDAFWPRVREAGVTTTILLGPMAGFLLDRPESAEDREHTLRTCACVPYGEAAQRFHARFGTDVHTYYSMTEVPMPLRSGPNPEPAGTAGGPRPGVEVRIVDANDCEVPTGSVGELVLRADTPWAITPGYLGDPAATAAAWRNGWFHTGDAFRRDADGAYAMVGRLKDTIRRRGENISPAEVEAEVAAHEAVREAAAVAAKSDTAEDEVLVAVTLADGAGPLDHAGLIDFLRPRMAHFMIPRYVRVMDELPKTDAGAVDKPALTAAGVTADTWDREAAGIRIKREKLGCSRG